MADITQMAARSGKIIRSDNTIVNEADGINNDGSRRVQLTGSNLQLGQGLPVQSVRKMEIETVLNAATIQPNNFSQKCSVDYKGESLTFYAITTDKAPYSFLPVSLFYASGYGECSYPVIKLFNTSAPNPSQPIIVLQTFFHKGNNPVSPQTWNEAEVVACSFDGQGFYVRNDSTTDVLTVTVKVVRVWR